MAFRASLSVFLGCQFGQATKLLSAAERGEVKEVKQVLVSKPQLAAFTGFHGTTSPLHRAAAAGHLSTCKAIIELIKSRILETEQAVINGKQRSSTLKRWKSLLKTVIDQRSHRGQTPIMLACEAGHADVTAFLLAEGADALAVDMFHCRTALHYAAAGGHAQCIKVLCSDSAFVEVEGTRRLLRDVVTDDLQVRSAKFVDQRSSGGLTALHFAAVSGNLDSLQALLKAGAAIMVKTDAEAFIGQEYLTTGSTPLHIAVIVGSIPLAHALLQAHAEMMTVVSHGRDERHRRHWEGHSRSDIRSVRNASRKLPYHIARDKGWTQMMHLIDPRISVDAALDAARDTDHGIGPKNLATICSLVLQTSLLQWLDQTETEIEAEKEKSESGDIISDSPTTMAKKDSLMASLSSPFAAGGVVAGAEEGDQSVSQQEDINNGTIVSLTPRDQHSSDLNSVSDNADGVSATPLGASPTTTSGPAQSLPLVATSAPAIPALSMQSMGSLHTYLGMLCTRRPSPFDSSDSPLHKQDAQEGQDILASSRHHGHGHHHQRSATLAYGDLARLTPIASQQQQQPTASPATAAAPGATRASSFTLRNRGLPRASSTGTLTRALGPLQLAFSSSSIQPADATVFLNVRTSGGRPATATAAAGGENLIEGSVSYDDGTCIQDHHHHEEQQQQQQQQGTMRRVLSSLREKLKSSDGSSSAADGDSAQDLTSYAESTDHNNNAAERALDTASEECNNTCITTTSTTADTMMCGSSSASEYACTSGSCGGDAECGVCLDSGVQVAFSGCEHALCLQCARNLTKQEKKPPSCPFCRRMVVGFVKVHSSNTI